MRKLILQEWLSLDGFAEDRDGQLGFFPSTEANRRSDQDQLEFLAGIDAILLGRKTYQLFAGYWPTASAEQEIVADRLNAIPKAVFSNTLREAPWGKWPGARIVPGDAVREVERMEARDGKDMVLWGSLSLAQSLIRAGLVDEYHIQICPTLAGGGRSLFPDLEAYSGLKLGDAKAYETGVVFLRYLPAGS